MKVLYAIGGALLGAALATISCWGLLYLYGAVVLRGYGSLFDTNPQVANAFFLTWGLVSVVSAIAGATLAAKIKRASKSGRNRSSAQ